MLGMIRDVFDTITDTMYKLNQAGDAAREERPCDGSRSKTTEMFLETMIPSPSNYCPHDTSLKIMGLLQRAGLESTLLRQ